MAIGKVIKGDAPLPDAERSQPSSRPRGVLDAEGFEARQEAQAILAKARRDAADILADAEARKEAFIEEGREVGRQEVLAQANEVVARAHVQRDALIQGATNDILELALKVAEKIIGRDLERDPQTLVEICATAIETTRGNKAMVLRVNPADIATLKEHQKDLLDRVGQLVAIAIKEDGDVAPGGVIIQTEGGTTDAQLATQLEMLRLVLTTADEIRAEDRA